jgi:hypothetical protein
MLETRVSRYPRVATNARIVHRFVTIGRMVRDIDDVQGLSTDARRLYDWMTAAFTGDVNEALDLAKSHNTSIAKWSADRLGKAYAELKERGVLAPTAPALRHAKKKGTTTSKKKRFTCPQCDGGLVLEDTYGLVCPACEVRVAGPFTDAHQIPAYTQADDPDYKPTKSHATKKTRAQLDKEIAESLRSGGAHTRHAHATMGKPSKEKLQEAAKWIRRELTKRADSGHPSHLAAKVLEEADEKFDLGSFGVEGWAKSPSVGYQYLNYGDSYDPTIIVRSNRTEARVSVALGGWASYA